MKIKIHNGIKCIELKGHLVEYSYARCLYKLLTPKYISNYRDADDEEIGFAWFFEENPELAKEINPLLLLSLIRYVFPEWRSKHKRYFKKEHTLKEWDEKLIEYNHRCAYCGKDGKMTQDHVIPITSGGSDLISNIVPACMGCNRAKSAYDLHDFLNKIQY